MMGAEDTVLVGCEVLCLSFESSDYVACPLPPEEQKVCRQRLQYEAGRESMLAEVKSGDVSVLDLLQAAKRDGIRGVVEWMKRYAAYPHTVEQWQTKLKEWEIDDSNRQ